MSVIPVKCLLVDDLGENLFALEALLRQEGLEVLTARSGMEALELLLVHDVALAIVDVQMPGMDGFELAELMRGTERTRHVPIIFLTAGGVDEQRRFRGYEAGAVDFLFKPVDPHTVRSKAGVFFELYRQRVEVARQREELRATSMVNARLLEESRRTAAALQEADQRKDEFLAMLAHELRNPLAPILNATAVLRARETDDPVRIRQQEIIRRQAEHMARIVNDLLDVSRITRGNLVVEQEVVDLTETVRSCVGDYRHSLEELGVRLEVHLPPGTLYARGDRIRLCQALGNLVSNAGKFTPAGGCVTVTLGAGEREEYREAVITVRDTGAGISPELLPRVWDSFVQGEQDFARSRGGLGLGLALVKAVVETHGGTVRVASEGAGHGAEFTLTLPLLTQDVVAPARAPLPEEARRRRILLIEDNRDAAETLRELLQMQGHSVTVALNGPEGLVAARSMQPEFILCDLGLPGLDGYEVARRLRAEIAPEATLVALSGYAQPEHVERARAAGFNAHLAKPLDPDQLFCILENG